MGDRKSSTFPSPPRQEERPPLYIRVARELVQETVAFRQGITLTAGSFDSLTQLFFEILSTLLGVIYALQSVVSGSSVTTDFLNQILYGKVVPGMGLSILIGNLYYSWQAIRLTRKWGRQYTAQPYGLNTPAAFSFIYNILAPVFFANVATLGGNEAFQLAYNVSLAANFVSGLTSLVLGLFGPQILRLMPPAALLVPIAALGVAFLGLQQLCNSIAAPIVGYPCITLVFMGWYAGVKVGCGRKVRCPEALQVIVTGVILGWATGLNQGQDVKDSLALVRWWGPAWSAGELFQNFSTVQSYLGIIIPIGLTAMTSTLMCLVSAKEAGDPFPVRETLIVDGAGTLLASFFGSPFGTSVYIGHPAHKRNGAGVGYSLMNGMLYLLLSWTGLFGLLASIVNFASIGPINFFVGVLINEEALNFIPARHIPAYIIGLFPPIYEWMISALSRTPIMATDGEYNSTYPQGDYAFIGILAWARGSLLVSMLWTAVTVMILDRKWVHAMFWALFSSALAAVGIIHAPQAGFATFAEPSWEQCPSLDSNGIPTCWDYAEQWTFFVGYLIMSAMFGVTAIWRRFDSYLLDEVRDDETTNAFADWFKNAGNRRVSVVSTSFQVAAEHGDLLLMMGDDDDDDDSDDSSAKNDTAAKQALNDDPAVMEHASVHEDGENVPLSESAQQQAASEDV